MDLHLPSKESVEHVTSRGRLDRRVIPPSSPLPEDVVSLFRDLFDNNTIPLEEDELLPNLRSLESPLPMDGEFA